MHIQREPAENWRRGAAAAHPRTRNGLFVVLLGVVALSLQGCWRSSESFLTASPRDYESVDPDSVRVFLSLSELEEFDWDGIALIKSEFLIEPELDGDWVADLQREAGKIGANAILIMGPMDIDSRQRLAASLLGPIRFRAGDVIAVRTHGPKSHQPTTRPLSELSTSSCSPVGEFTGEKSPSSLSLSPRAPCCHD